MHQLKGDSYNGQTFVWRLDLRAFKLSKHVIASYTYTILESVYTALTWRLAFPCLDLAIDPFQPIK